MNEANWEQEAKKQAAECGELKIKIAERLESVQKRISAREAARDDTETSMELFEILNRDLVNEEKWLTAILKEGGSRHMIFIAFVAGMIVGVVVETEWALYVVKKEKGRQEDDESI